MKTSTIYLKSIKDKETNTILKPGTNNKKLGNKVKSKKWKGKKIYSLTLVERETCPASCHHWDDCYGNNMPFAHRFNTIGLEEKIESELDELMEKHKEGIVIRLHVLGDFYSTDYVRFWQEMLFKFPALCIFGYTARNDDIIGIGIDTLNFRFSERCRIRFSSNEVEDCIRVYAANEDFPPKRAHFTCPEQTGKMKSCADCGLCWTTTKTVRFLNH